MRLFVTSMLVSSLGCSSPPPPEAWEEADALAQMYAGRVARLKNVDDRRAQQVGLEGIFVNYQHEVSPRLRELCGPPCVTSIEYRFGAMRSAFRSDDAPVEPARRALELALREVVFGPKPVEQSAPAQAIADGSPEGDAQKPEVVGDPESEALAQ